MLIITKLVNFLKDSKTELKKVNWPTKEQTIRYTIIVVAISLGVALFLGILDIIFLRLINIFLIK